MVRDDRASTYDQQEIVASWLFRKPDGASASTVLATDGPCTATEWMTGAPEPPSLERCGDIGDISVTGTFADELLQNECQQDGRAFTAAWSQDGPIFDGGVRLTFDIAGGADFPAHTAQYDVPDLLDAANTWNQLVLGAPYDVTWGAGNGDQVRIVVSNSWPSDTTGRTITCKVPDTGAFQIPGSLTALLPSYAYATGYLERTIDDEVWLSNGDARLRYHGVASLIVPIKVN